MRQLKFIFLLFLTFNICGTLRAQQTQDAVIRITPNEFERVYKVFFASQIDFKTRVTLTRLATGDLIVDETIIGNGFLKLYSLKDAPTGTYEWSITYGSNEYNQTFEVRTKSQLMKESIQVELDDLLNLSISIQPYNTKPVSIFFYNGSGDQLEYIFWEPKEGELEKVFHLSDYDAYDIKVEILQGGDVQYSNTFQMY